MKPTTAFSLLALAYASTVIAVLIPEAPVVYAVEAEQDSNTLEAREPMMWGPKKFFLGENGYKRDVEEEDLDKRMMWGPKKFFLGENGYKRDVGKPDGQGQGERHGFDGGQGHTKPADMPQGMPQGGSGHQGPQGGPQAGQGGPPQGGPQGFGQGQGMGAGQGQGKPDGGMPFGGQGKPE